MNSKICQLMYYKKLTLLLILLVTFFLRFALFSFTIIPHEKRGMGPDSYGYDLLAVNMLQNHTFSLSQQPPFIPDLHRTPIYPLFLASLYSVFGRNPVVAIFFNIIISVLTVFVTYRLGLKLFNETTALFVAFLLAIDPISIIESNILITEILFSLLLLLGLFFLIRSFKEINILSLLVSSLLLSLSALTRPITVYLPLVLIPVFVHKYRKSVHNLFIKLAVFLIIFFIPVGGWILRNYSITGEPVFCTIQDINLVYYRAAGVMAEISGEDFESVQKRFSNEHPLDLVNNPEEYKASVRFAKAVIISNPFTYMKVAFTGFIKTLLGPGKESAYSLIGLDKAEGRYIKILVVAVEFLILGFIYLGFTYGIFLLIRNRNYHILGLVVLILAYFIILSSGPESYSRFRMPIMPYVCLISGLGFCGILRAFKTRFAVHTTQQKIE